MSEPVVIQKEYLGDGVYADFDGYHVVLYTHNGISRTNTICLEPEVVTKFADYYGRLERKLEAQLRELEKETEAGNDKTD